MDFGIQVATSAYSWKVVKRAEELGFTHAWFYDTQLLNADVFVAMAAAAVNTSRIRLGTGVLVPSNRIAPVTANALASLNALAPGRIDFGVSTGYTARRTLGLPALTLASLEEYVRVVQGLLKGEMVEWAGEGSNHKIRFMSLELQLINLCDPIKVHISAFGPKARRLVAKLGTCWMTAMRNTNSAGAAMGDMRRSWEQAGRDIRDLYATAIGGGCVLKEGEPADSLRAKAQAGPAAAMIFHDFNEQDELGTLGFPAPPQFKTTFERYRELYRTYEPAEARYLSNHRGHLMFLRPDERDLITGDVIRTLTFTGTRAELVEQLREVAAAGYKQFAFHARQGHEEEMLQDWAEVCARV